VYSDKLLVMLDSIMQDVDSAYQIIWLTRRLFRALAQKADASLQDMGISVADRAVMEFLYPDESLSVPEIAELYQVSRQHVQVTVNGLLLAGILAARVNPRHKRSPLIRLTSKGEGVFKTIKARDKKIVKKLFSKISEKDKSVTKKTLAALLAELQ
jgi:DNA-binding MarR family transcriptional regulator